MTKARKFTFGKRPAAKRPATANAAPLSHGKPSPQSIDVPKGPPPSLAYPGKTRYARVFDAMVTLEANGFEDTITTGELVSTAGYFAQVEPLSSDPGGPCDVHVRAAFSRPRP